MVDFLNFLKGLTMKYEESEGVFRVDSRFSSPILFVTSVFT